MTRQTKVRRSATPSKGPRSDKSRVVDTLAGGASCPDLPLERLEAEQLAHWIERARKLPMVRKDLVRRVRAQIDAGTYETPRKLERAVERMIEDVADL